MPARSVLRVLWIWGPLLAYLVLIFYLSSLPQIDWVGHYPDYLEHAAEYCGLALLTVRALNGGLLRPAPVRLLGIAFFLCLGYAISDEIHQYFVPNRLADVRDVVSDALGAAAGLGALHLGHRVRSAWSPS